MEFFFADEARQRTPSRSGMESLVAIGGISVSSEVLGKLEKAINSLCSDFGFPKGEEFKWSPGRELWISKHLLDEKRTEFFIRLLNLLENNKAKALVVIEDEKHSFATTGASSSEEDVTCMFLERVSNQLINAESEGLVIVDKPGGSSSTEKKFLGACLEVLQDTKNYIKPGRILLNVLTSNSKFLRLLQVADLVTGCTLARVAGEDKFSPPVFDSIKQLFYSELGRVGGVGLKIHPDFRYANLYHWLLGDSDLIRYPMGAPLPLGSRPYHLDPDHP